MAERSDSRWGGRNRAKAAVRESVWKKLVDANLNVGPAFDRIPNFVGADLAAKRLSDLDEWRRARVIKCNPDPPQIPVRLRALYDGKLLFSPVPYLSRAFPTCASIPTSSRQRGSISKPRPRRKASWSMASRSASRRCPSSISASSAASRSVPRRADGEGRRIRRSRAGDLSRAWARKPLDADRDDGSFLANRRRLRGRHGEP